MKKLIKKVGRNKTFWESLGFSISKPDKEGYKLDPNKEIFKIEKKYQLNFSEVKKIKDLFNNFERNPDKVNLKYFLRFFNTHTEGIKFFYNSEDTRKNLMNLLKSCLLKPNDFHKIHFYHLWLREGRRYSYDIKIDKSQLRKLKEKRKGFFVPRIKGTTKRYSEEARVLFDKQKFLLFIIKKGSTKNNTPLYIGIRIFKSYAKLFLSNRFNPLERHVVLKLMIKNKIDLDTVPNEIDYSQLMGFINNPSFIKDPFLDLIGVCFDKNGVIFNLEEEEGIPQNSVNIELKRIKTEDITFKQLRKVSFYYNKGGVIKKNKYQISNPFEGIIHFSLNSAGKGNEDYLEAIDMFNSQFGFMPDKAYSDPSQDKKRWYEQFLDKNKYTNYKGLELPLIAIKVLGELKEEGLITNSKVGAFGSVCYSNCSNKGQKIWSFDKITCPSCGGNLFYMKEELSYEKPINGLKQYVKKKLEKKGYKFLMISKKVFNEKVNVVKAFKDNEELTILFSRNKKDLRYLQEFAERSSNIMILECGADADSINEPVYTQKLSKIFYEEDKDFFSEAISHQNKRWDERRISCANKSLINLIRIHNKKDKFYKGFQFEKDCFNLINSFLDNCVWLGSKDSGGKVPDGIAELKEVRGKEGCLIWDCKLSFKKEGASVGSLKKNKSYVDNLFKHDLIQNLGGLKSYLIISNKANQTNYMNIFTKLKENYSGFKKEVNYSLLDSRQLVKIFEYIKENTKYFETDQIKKKSFFNDLNHLLIGDGVKIISDKEITDLFTKHSTKEGEKKLLENADTFRPEKQK